MNWLDITLLCLAGIGFVKGLFDGIIKQVVSLIALVIAIFFCGKAAAWLKGYILALGWFPEEGVTILSYIAGFILIMGVFILAGELVTKVVGATPLSVINHLFGGFFGLLVVLVFTSLLLNALEFVDRGSVLIHRQSKIESRFYYSVKQIVPTIFPNHIINEVTSGDYKYGFVTDIDTEVIHRGLDEETVRIISAKKNEPEWLLEFRLKAFRHWQTLEMPTWPHLNIPPIDYQDIIYYAAPKKKEGPKSLDEVDPELLKTFDKLGIPLEEQKHLSGMAVDAVMDSVSVKTTFKENLAEKGIIFCSFSEAVQHHPDLVQKYLGSVVGYRDNFFAALNSAVFSDGSFVYIPKGVRCPMELSTYFRINAANTGQFERTLIVADDEAYVSYLEGCTAPMRDENQLHAAIVEIVANERAEVKYSTVQNWYPGDKEGKGGIYNFVTKRGLCKGEGSKISWTQVETGSAITWKYPSCILAGDNSVGEFYSVAVTNNYQQADTGTKMIHLGKNTKSTIVSKGISAGHSQNSYRGLVKVSARAEGARNHSQCDSLLLSSTCGAHTFPYADIQNETAIVEHEATTSKISEEQLFYCQQRGISVEEAVGLIVNGYAREVMNKLPMEFAVEAQKLLTISLEGSVG